MKRLILIPIILFFWNCNTKPEKDRCENYHDEHWYYAPADTICFCRTNYPDSVIQKPSFCEGIK